MTSVKSTTERNSLKESFLKSQLSSIASTFVDFSMLAFCTEILGVFYVHSKIIGACCGAIVGFILGRNWAFKGGQKSTRNQGVKYFLTAIISGYLNVKGIYILTEHYNIQYFISNVIVAVTVAIFFNFVMYRYFVFK